MERIILRIITVSAIVLFITTSCNKRSYPCPGNGTVAARDLSLFDDDGNLKSEKQKRNSKGDNGLITKKKDDRLKNRRKRYLNDTPKNLKK